MGYWVTRNAAVFDYPGSHRWDSDTGRLMRSNVRLRQDQFQGIRATAASDFANTQLPR